ncbi:hypothetical protein CDL15_Pgr004021 [Punica granatum]|nr:hypothetical protein CDL15_Pgr004021 [Punica granatum]
MYEETPCFGPDSNHPSPMVDSAIDFAHGSSSEEKQREPVLRLPVETQQEDEDEDEHLPNIGTHLLQEMTNNPCDHLSSLNWGSITAAAAYKMPRVFDTIDNEVQGFGALPNTSFPPTPAIFNHFTLQPQSAPLLFPSTRTVHDPTFDLNSPLGLHCAPPLALVRELFQSLPLSGEVLFGDGGEHDIAGEGREEGLVQVQNGGASELRGGRNGTKQQPANERERRSHMKERFNDLRMMIPNSTKTDRASVVGDSIEYIKELKRTVDELKLLLDRRRCGRERKDGKRQRMDQDQGDVNSCITNKLPGDPNMSYSTGLRSSMLRRKSKATEVDVRIVDDEVTVKLVLRRKINCLLHVSRVLDELQLDLQHVAGGQIGDHYSFLFNSKICEGSVFASTIAGKLIDAVDGHYAVAPPDQ